MNVWFDPYAPRATPMQSAKARADALAKKQANKTPEERKAAAAKAAADAGAIKCSICKQGFMGNRYSVG